jgi:hypothetical protein
MSDARFFQAGVLVGGVMLPMNAGLLICYSNIVPGLLVVLQLIRHLLATFPMRLTNTMMRVVQLLVVPVRLASIGVNRHGLVND